MPTYVVRYRFTDDGRCDIKGTVQRTANVREANEQRGFKVLGHYWTQGRFDLGTNVEALSEDAMMARSLQHRRGRRLQRDSADPLR